jgi:hypothetical protein
LIRFDLASMAGHYSTINSAKLRLFTEGSPVGADTINVFQVADANADWIEGVGTSATGYGGEGAADGGAATWNFKVQAAYPDEFNGQPWAGGAFNGAGVAGTDYLTPALASFSFDNTIPAGTAIDIDLPVALVQQWINGINAGVILRGSEGNGAVNRIFFFASEYPTDPAKRPCLLIDYTPAPPACVELPSGAVAWWRAEGNANDSAGSHNGTVAGATFTTGYVGQAFGFNGSSYVQVATGPILGSAANFTIEAWVKWDGGGLEGQQEIYSEGSFNDIVNLFLNKQGAVAYPVFQTLSDNWRSATSPTPINPGEWHHIAGVLAAGVGGKLYVDGQVVATNPNMGPGSQGTSSSDIGRFAGNGSSRYYSGLIDELTLYSRPLTGTEIQGIFNADSSGKCVPAPPLPALSVDDVIVQEGTNGTTAFFFAVSMQGTNVNGASVSFATADGTLGNPATVGVDYTATNGILSWAAGDTFTKNFIVYVYGDTTVEPDEYFLVNLSNPVGATLARAQGTGFILNDDTNAPAGCVTQTINFDALNALGSPVSGPALDTYLAQFGVTISGVTAGSTMTVYDDRDIYSGQAVTTSSGHNLITQSGLNTPVSYTLNFDHGYESVTFTRPRMFAATPSGITRPAWQAYALDAGGFTVATVSEPAGGSFSEFPAVTFTLTGSAPIVALRIDSQNSGSAFNAMLMDDLVLTCPPPPPPCITQTINFDALNALGSPVSGAALDAYLASYGVTISNVTAGSTMTVYDDRDIYSGQAVTTSSPHNLLTQAGVNSPVTYTLNFDHAYSGVTFTRPRMFAATPSGITRPAWQAYALDAGGNTVAFASESAAGSFSEFPAQTFTLSGSALIVALRVDSQNSGTAFSALLLDDLVLTCPPPPPNQNPSVTINGFAPPGTGAGGDTYFGASASVSVDFSASDSDGRVVRVELYDGAILIDSLDEEPGAGITTDSLGPISYSVGDHNLTVKAIDDQGGMGTASKMLHVINE